MAPEGTTTIIYRPSGTITGFRESIDEASRISVMAFPFSAIPDVTADKTNRLGHRLSTPGLYTLCDADSAYIGESATVRERLLDHTNAPSKSFAKEVWVVSAFSKNRFDKTAALYFQWKFRTLAVAAGHMHILGPPPPKIHLSDNKSAPLDAMFETARRLAFDAGCRAFDSALPPRIKPAAGTSEGEAGGGDAGDAAEVGYFEIGVATAPQGAAEFELRYGNIWARGHTLGNVFVISAGSDIRAAVNPSSNAIYRDRHRILKEHGVVQPIPGVIDRLRLTQAIAVGSAAIGAKMVTGAHVNSGQWRPLRPGRQLSTRE